MSKKMFALVLCVMLMLAMSITVAAATSVSGSLSASSVNVGDTVTVTISMSEATVSSLGIKISPDEGLEVVSGEWLISGVIANFDDAKNNGAFAAGSAAPISGSIFRVTLRAKATGSRSVSVQVIGKNGTQEVFRQSVSKTVTIKCASHTMGSYTQTSTHHIRTCSACGYEAKSAHSYDTGRVTAQSTCTAQGVKTYSCTVCGHAKTELLDKSDHSYDGGKITVQPSCTAQGQKSYTCSVCAATKTESIAMLAHSYGAWQDDGKGHHVAACSCGHSLTQDHNWGKETITTQPGCTSAGVKEQVCSDCGAKVTEAIPMTGHSYDYSCDTTCNICGAQRTASHSFSQKWSSNQANHFHACIYCGEGVDVFAHTPSDWILDKPAQDMEAGLQHKECSVCGKVLESVVLPATGCQHSAGTQVAGHVAPTCESVGYSGDTVCVTCGTVMTPGAEMPAVGHAEQSMNAVEATCQTEGYSGDVNCAVCGKTLRPGQAIPTVPHSYVGGSCAVCGQADPDMTQPHETTPTPAMPSTEPQRAGEKSSDDGTWLLLLLGGEAALVIALVVLLRKKKKAEK